MIPVNDINFHVWSLQVTITLTEAALLIFLQSGIDKLLVWPGIEPTSLDLGLTSQPFQPFMIKHIFIFIKKKLFEELRKEMKHNITIWHKRFKCSFHSLFFSSQSVKDR